MDDADMCEFTLVWHVDCRACGKTSYVKAKYLVNEPWSVERLYDYHPE